MSGLPTQKTSDQAALERADASLALVMKSVSYWQNIPPHEREVLSQKEVRNLLKEFRTMMRFRKDLAQGSSENLHLEHFLDDISCKIPKGVFCGVLDTDGKARQFLIRLLAHSIAPKLGSISIHGLAVSAGWLRAVPMYFDSIEDNLREFARLAGFGPKDAEVALAGLRGHGYEEKLTWALRRVPKRWYTDLGHLFISLLRADVFIFEEAAHISGPQRIRQQIAKELSSRVAAGATVVLSSARPSRLMEMCDFFLLCDETRLCDVGDVDFINSQHADEFQKALQTPYATIQMDLPEDSFDEEDDDGEVEALDEGAFDELGDEALIARDKLFLENDTLREEARDGDSARDEELGSSESGVTFYHYSVEIENLSERVRISERRRLKRNKRNASTVDDPNAEWVARQMLRKGKQDVHALLDGFPYLPFSSELVSVETEVDPTRVRNPDGSQAGDGQHLAFMPANAAHLPILFQESGGRLRIRVKTLKPNVRFEVGFDLRWKKRISVLRNVLPGWVTVERSSELEYEVCIPANMFAVRPYVMSVFVRAIQDGQNGKVQYALEPMTAFFHPLPQDPELAKHIFTLPSESRHPAIFESTVTGSIQSVGALPGAEVRMADLDVGSALGPSAEDGRIIAMKEKGDFPVDESIAVQLHQDEPAQDGPYAVALDGTVQLYVRLSAVPVAPHGILDVKVAGSVIWRLSIGEFNVDAETPSEWYRIAVAFPAGYLESRSYDLDLMITDHDGTVFNATFELIYRKPDSELGIKLLSDAKPAAYFLSQWQWQLISVKALAGDGAQSGDAIDVADALPRPAVQQG